MKTGSRDYWNYGFQAGFESAIRSIVRIIANRPNVPIDYDLIAEIRKMEENSFLVSGDEKKDDDHGQATIPPADASHSIGNESYSDSDHGIHE